MDFPASTQSIAKIAVEGSNFYGMIEKNDADLAVIAPTFSRILPMAPATTPQTDKKYTLLDRIGTGGMAEVYRGRLSGAEGFAKLVVIKKLLPHFADDPQVVAHFIAEAKLAALLQHENIVQVYDFGEEGGSYFIAMECLFGKDLHTILRRARELHDPLGVEHTLMIVAKVCEAMEYAHTLRDFHQQPLHIIHRDLSPHNIFVTYEGRVKIIDFGIARTDLFDHQTQIGVAKGKLAYMAPEQLEATAIDHRADIFAIGILLYEMLSGQRLYSGDTATMLRRCLQGEHQSLRQVCPGLNPALYDIVDKALAREVGCRYQSCAQLQADIEECLFAVNRRPSPHLLEQLLQRLFAEEMAAEKRERRQVLPGFAAVGDRTGSHHPPGPEPSATPMDEPTTVATLSGIKPPPGAPEKTPAPLPAVPVRRRYRLALAVTALLTLCLIASAIAFQELSKDWDVEPLTPAATVPMPTTPDPGSSPPESTADGGNFLQGSGHTLKGMFQAPKDGRYSLLQDSFEKKRQRLITDLEAQAEEAVRQQHLTAPAEDNAVWYYRKVLALDPDHQGARLGLVRLAETYANRAEEAFASFRIREARGYVREGLAVLPDYPQLLELHRDLTASKPRIALKGLEKRLAMAEH